jgi:hypothetical protein
MSYFYSFLILSEIAPVTADWWKPKEEVTPASKAKQVEPEIQTKDETSSVSFDEYYETECLTEFDSLLSYEFNNVIREGLFCIPYFIIYYLFIYYLFIYLIYL